MPAKWTRRVFWLRSYEGKISCESFELADAANMRPLLSGKWRLIAEWVR
jgi:hypothetical protein